MQSKIKKLTLFSMYLYMLSFAIYYMLYPVLGDSGSALYYSIKGIVTAIYIVITIYAFIIYIYNLLFRKLDNIWLSIIAILFVLSIILGAISIIRGNYALSALRIIQKTTFLFPFVFIGYFIIKDKDYLYKFIKLFRWFALLNSILVIWELCQLYGGCPDYMEAAMSNIGYGGGRYLTHVGGKYFRVFGAMDTAQTLGAILALGAITELIIFIYKKTKTSLILMIIHIITLVLSLSKVGIAVFIFLALYSFYEFLFSRYKKRVVVKMATFLLIGSLFPLIFITISITKNNKLPLEKGIEGLIRIATDKEYGNVWIESLNSTLEYIALPFGNIGIIPKYLPYMNKDFIMEAPIFGVIDAIKQGKNDHFEYEWLNYGVRYGFIFFLLLGLFLAKVIKEIFFTPSEDIYILILKAILLGLFLANFHYQTIGPVMGPLFWLGTGYILKRTQQEN